MISPRRTVLPIVFAVSVFFLTGCVASADMPEASTSATPAPTPTATAEPVVVAAPAPAQAFGGDCAQVLTDAQVGNAVGAAVEANSSLVGLAPDPEPALSPYAYAIPTVGGVACEWGTPGVVHGPGLSLTVVPVAAIEGTAGGELLQFAVNRANVCADPVTYCVFSLVAEGWWFQGVLNLASAASEGEANAAVESLLPLVSAAVDKAGVAPNALARNEVDGAWSTNTDCTALAQAVDASTMLAIPGLAITDHNPGPVEAPYGWNAARLAAGQDGCLWAEEAVGTTSQSTAIEFLPAGAWALDVIAALPGVRELAGEGAQRVFFMPASVELGTTTASLHVFDGANWAALRSSRGVDESYLPFASALVEAKNLAG